MMEVIMNSGKIVQCVMKRDAQAYWNANLRLIIGCLLVWFTASLLFGIVLVELLNYVRLGGYRLGFWFAQQGSICTFVGLIFFYAWRMNILDQKFNVQDN